MQFTAIIALAIAATGALAAPGYAPPPPPKAPKAPKPPTNQAIQYATCSGGAPYCCSTSTGDYSSGGDVHCSKLENQCNSIVVCCNQINQGKNGGTQVCAAFGTAKVYFD
ncbi:hypothetical protein BKA56DRAFT_596782 [Ilyonectria sp. MPI-CAGE-AT-0026]|nr:hypothetical protein BKA56DRAFT_596782 [Ilyonectria sp. MPI-CAGE-AT-0026]